MNRTGADQRDADGPDGAFVAAYERNQARNRLFAWLHGLRFRHALRVIDAAAAALEGRPVRVVDIGCGQARLFSLLEGRVPVTYTGIELRADFVAAATARHGESPGFAIRRGRAADLLADTAPADVVVALETLEHMSAEEAARTLDAVAAIAPRRFVCSVPVEVGPIVWIKNAGSLMTGYVRHQEYRWRDTFWAGLGRLDRVPPHARGHRGFDWRRLTEQIEPRFRMRAVRRFPFTWLPAGLATSVFIDAEPRV